jgi:hypothetical protein
MKSTHVQSLIRALWEPKAVILVIALLHFLWGAVYVAQELRTENGRAADAQFYLFEPILLLMAAFFFWRGKLFGFAAALLISGWMVYRMGYLAYLRTAEVAGVSAFSQRALNAFYWGLFGEWEIYADKPRYTFQLTLAVVIASCATVLIALDVYRRLRDVRHGI